MDHAVWQTTHDLVNSYKALTSAASEGAWHLLKSCQKYFKLASQKMMHIKLETTSENFSWVASYELELNLNLTKQGILKHRQLNGNHDNSTSKKPITIANTYIYREG